MKNAIKKILKFFLERIFILGQHLGFDLLPRHYYSEIPDIRRLKVTDWWKKEYSMTGVSSSDLETQLQFLIDLFTHEIKNDLQRDNIHEKACVENESAGFGKIEAEVLYSFIRSIKPAKIIQIGCGVSTAICINASKNAGYIPQLTCIDPFPSNYLIEQSQECAITLINQPVENLESSFVLSLKDGDLFFIDSSHALGPAGEVSWIILELLPMLNKGVYIHFHDILFPYDYAPTILKNPQFFSHESALLHAFLTYNDSFKIMTSLSCLHYKRQKELCALFTNYKPAKHEYGLVIEDGDFPTSLYIRRMK